jgi:hypothetical protein
LGAVAGSLLDVLNLGRHRCYAAFVQHRYFSRRGPYIQTAPATVVADSHVRDVRHAIVVDVVNVRHIDVVDGAVIGELVMVPIPSLVTAAHISVTVIDTAVEADVRTPKSVM